MEDLHLIGVHDDGAHLLLGGPDGARFRLPIDAALRSAVKREPGRQGLLTIDVEGELRPRDVQVLIRQGVSVDEVAIRSGWSVEKVDRFAGPIVAEREYVAGLARAGRLRGRGPSALAPTQAPTLENRVNERLTNRGVEPSVASWDAWRPSDGPWTVAVSFPAGGRQRQASWRYDPADQTLEAADDEARWLSEDEPEPVDVVTGATGGPEASEPARSGDAVYDLEADGGMSGGREGGTDAPVDLMTAMRERSAADRRRSRPARRPAAKGFTDEPLPLEGGDTTPLPTGSDDPGPAASVEGAGAGGTATGEPGGPGHDPAGEAPEPSRKKSSRRGRPSVPAWDDIVFGKRSDTD